MSVGMSVNQMQLDAAAGRVCREIGQWVRDVQTLQTFLAATRDADMIGPPPPPAITDQSVAIPPLPPPPPPFNYAADDVALLKGAISDLAQLARIYRGQEPLTAPKDFTALSKRLAGLKAF